MKSDWLTDTLLLALASTEILGSVSHETHDHILLTDGSGSIQTSYLIVWSLNFVQIIFKNTFRTAQETLCLCYKDQPVNAV
jgi:hypothetical protein